MNAVMHVMLDIVLHVVYGVLHVVYGVLHALYFMYVVLYVDMICRRRDGSDAIVRCRCNRR